MSIGWRVMQGWERLARRFEGGPPIPPADPAAGLRARFVAAGGDLSALRPLVGAATWRDVVAEAPGGWGEPAAPALARARLADLARRLPDIRRRFFHYDAIVVPGSPAAPDGAPTWLNRERVGAGLALYARGVAPSVLVSGASVHTPQVEAAVLAALAIAGGLPHEALHRENRARTTGDNIGESLAIADRHGWRRLLFTSDAAHCRLIEWLARSEPRVAVAPIGGRLRGPSGLAPSGAESARWVPGGVFGDPLTRRRRAPTSR